MVGLYMLTMVVIRRQKNVQLENPVLVSTDNDVCMLEQVECLHYLVVRQDRKGKASSYFP